MALSLAKDGYLPLVPVPYQQQSPAAAVAVSPAAPSPSALEVSLPFLT